MKEGVYKFDPIVLMLVNIIIFIFTILLLLLRSTDYNNKIVFGTIVIACQTICIMACGLLIRRLYNEVYIDDLTGLYNRKFFNKKMRKIKSVDLISLILLDLDNFKKINDTYGHLVGDSVLQQLAGILNLTKRKGDIIVRWGGEEFFIILPGAGIEEAYKISNRIRTFVEKFTFSYDGVTCKITASMGVASTETSEDIKIEQLIKVIDKALYKAKEKKNNISVINI